MARGLSLASGMRWSAVAILGREGARMVSTVLVARFVGPEDFGTFAQAAVYMAILGLLLDQGLSSALIQRPHLPPELPGAVLTANLAVGTALAGLTAMLASTWAGFMRTPELTLVLIVLAPSLLIRSASVTPRALLIRKMEFRPIGVVDIAAAVIGGAVGVLAAALGAGYWALVLQIMFTDTTAVLALLGLGAFPRPSLRLGRLREIAGFSGRAFASGVLGTVAGNIDNLLVGRFQGPESLAFYSLGYRLLLLPIQLLGATIGNVLFPTFSRLADDVCAVRRQMSRATRVLASVVLPAMSLVAASAPQLVVLLFGSEWEPAVRIVQVLAIAGGIHAIYQPSIVPLMLGLGHAKLLLRFSVITNVVYISGIVAGVPFSPLAVALGYGAATLLMLPFEWYIIRRLVGTPISVQTRSLVPGVHVGLWILAGYTVVASLVDRSDLLELAIATPISTALGLSVMRLVHSSQLDELAFIAARAVGRSAGDSADSAPRSRSPRDDDHAS